MKGAAEEYSQHNARQKSKANSRFNCPHYSQDVLIYLGVPIELLIRINIIHTIPTYIKSELFVQKSAENVYQCQFLVSFVPMFATRELSTMK